MRNDVLTIRGKTNQPQKTTIKKCSIGKQSGKRMQELLKSLERVLSEKKG